MIPNSSLKPGGSEVVQNLEHCTFRGATARWKGVVEHRFSARLEDGFHRPKDRKQAFSVQGQPGHEERRFRQSPADRQGFLMVVIRRKKSERKLRERENEKKLRDDLCDYLARTGGINGIL